MELSWDWDELEGALGRFVSLEEVRIKVDTISFEEDGSGAEELDACEQLRSLFRLKLGGLVGLLVVCFGQRPSKPFDFSTT